MQSLRVCIKAINQYAKGIEGIRPHELGFKVGVIVEKDGDLKLSVKKVYSNVYGDYALIWEKEPTHE